MLDTTIKKTFLESSDPLLREAYRYWLLDKNKKTLHLARLVGYNGGKPKNTGIGEIPQEN